MPEKVVNGVRLYYEERGKRSGDPLHPRSRKLGAALGRRRRKAGRAWMRDRL
jgi:hypothetical protein